MKASTVLSSKIFVAGLVVSLAFLANTKYRQYKAAQAIEAEKASIVAQEDKLAKKNRELEQSLDMLTSKSYKERVIREQLNMKKEGELVYNFTEAPQQTAETTEPRQTTLGKQASNASKWWNYFFEN